MTYRELIEFCHKTPEEECLYGNCSCIKECDAFKNAVSKYPSLYPSLMYNALGVDLDTEIDYEVIEDDKNNKPIIKDAETVKVVRCKDCTYRCIADFGQFEVSYCELNSSKWAYHVGENDYCSRAIRKDKGNDI